MPALTAPESERSRPIAVSPTDWMKIAIDIDPLLAWKEKFQEWIKTVSQFREMEGQRFFKNPSDPRLKRVHMGWACNLISSGQLLAIELLKIKNADKERDKQLEFLDTFMTNIQSSIATWHSFDRDQEENSLCVRIQQALALRREAEGVKES